ncbi:MAG: hypothetical protein ACYC3H_01795 [Bellilinea sp.]
MLKQFLPILLISILLSGCGLINQASPTLSEEAKMATRVGEILTSMPTATGQSGDGISTPSLPTVLPTATIGIPATSTSAPTATEAATATPSLEPTPSPEPSATSAPSQQPTVVYTPPASDPTTKLGAADWSDSMDNGNYWPTGADQFTDVAFANGSMGLTGLTTTDGWRMTYPELDNFYIETVFQVNDCSGADRYGIIARVPVLTSPDRGYMFGFTCDGKYSLRRWNASIGAKGEMVNLIDWKTSAAINTGSTQTNRMGLMAVGDRLILYANGQNIGEVKDNTFSKGYFGIFVGARETEDFSIRVDQIRVWENPEQ